MPLKKTDLGAQEHKTQRENFPEFYIRQWQDADLKWVSDDYTLSYDEAELWTICKPVINDIPQRVLRLGRNNVWLLEPEFNSYYYSRVKEITLGYIHKPENEFEYTSLVSAFARATGVAKHYLREMVSRCEITLGQYELGVQYHA